MERRPWTPEEDLVLADYIKAHGVGRWGSLPKKAGLNRSGKSCRLRWLKYLRPDIKRGNISPDEEELILRLHRLLGNRWSLIAGRLPGRTDYEIKAYWNSTLRKRAEKSSSKNLYIPKAQRHPYPGKCKLNTILREDDNTGIPHNVIQSSICWEKEMSKAPAAFWATMLKSAEVDTKAQASTQRHEHHNFCLSINKGDWALHPPFDRETTTTSNNMEVESHRSNNRLLSGLHRGEDAGENAMEDPVMNFDFGVDVFLSDLFNPEILEGSDPSSLASLADLLNSETMVGSKPSSPPMADLLISEVMVYSNPSLLPSSDSPTCDLDGKNQSCK